MLSATEKIVIVQPHGLKQLTVAQFCACESSVTKRAAVCPCRIQAAAKHFMQPVALQQLLYANKGFPQSSSIVSDDT